jgi:hypothetical protein
MRRLTAIAGVIAQEIEALVDIDAWIPGLGEETRNRFLLAKASENWAELEDFLGAPR